MPTSCELSSKWRAWSIWGERPKALQNDQSTVSRKIVRLEHEVGVPLFERIGRSIRLTKAGRRFVGRAERILGEMRDAVAEAAGTVSPRPGRSTSDSFIRSEPTGCPSASPASSTSTRGALHPRGRDHRRGRRRRAGRQLRPGILGPPGHTPELELVPLFRERIAVVVPLEHHLVGRSSVTLRDIATEPLILPRSRTGLRRVIDDAFARQGLSERVAYEGDDFAIVQGLAEAGLGSPSCRCPAHPLQPGGGDPRSGTHRSPARWRSPGTAAARSHRQPSSSAAASSRGSPGPPVAPPPGDTGSC